MLGIGEGLPLGAGIEGDGEGDGDVFGASSAIAMNVAASVITATPATILIVLRDLIIMLFKSGQFFFRFSFGTLFFIKWGPVGFFLCPGKSPLYQINPTTTSIVISPILEFTEILWHYDNFHFAYTSVDTD